MIIHREDIEDSIRDGAEAIIATIQEKYSCSYQDALEAYEEFRVNAEADQHRRDIDGSY